MSAKAVDDLASEEVVEMASDESMTSFFGEVSAALRLRAERPSDGSETVGN